MDGGVRLGLPGTTLPSGHHVCGLYDNTAERDRMLIPYFRTGLHEGDTCVVVLDLEDPEPVLSELGTSAEVEEWTAAGRLEVRTAVAAQPIPAAGLTPEEMFEVWSGVFAVAHDLPEHGSIRIGGEVTWWLPQAVEDNLVLYEIELTRQIPPALGALCLYDLSRFDGRAFVEAIQTHPLVAVGDQVIDNPFFIPPDRLLADHVLDDGAVIAPTAQEVRDRLHHPDRSARDLRR